MLKLSIDNILMKIIKKKKNKDWRNYYPRGLKETTRILLIPHLYLYSFIVLNLCILRLCIIKFENLDFLDRNWWRYVPSRQDMVKPVHFCIKRSLLEQRQRKWP